MTTNPPVYLALDPGGSTGWATFDEKGDGCKLGTCRNRRDVYNLLAQPEIRFGVHTVIMEDWITKANQKLGGDRLEVVRVIGVVEYYCELTKKALHHQPNTIKSIGFMWAGMDKPKSSDPLRHAKDAYVHGVHWLQQQGIRKPQQGVIR